MSKPPPLNRTSNAAKKTSSDFFSFIHFYREIQGILSDEFLIYYAFAHDMKVEDFANMLIKTFLIKKGVMEKQISIPIKSSTGTQRHTLDMTYGDFITDRSGPKFGGYLDENAGIEYLQGNLSTNPEQSKSLNRDEIVKQRKNETIALNDQFENEVNSNSKIKSKLDKVLSIYYRSYATQRKLSDFDLTASELSELTLKIVDVLKNNYQIDLSFPRHEELAREVVETLWSVGGSIDVGKIREIMRGNLDVSYSNYIKSQLPSLPPDERHILVPIGKELSKLGLEDIKPEVDATYGLGIAFMGPEVKVVEGKLCLSTELIRKYKQEIAGISQSDNPAEQTRQAETIKENYKAYFPGEDFEKVLKHEGLYEIGDVICDSRSHYESAFSLTKNKKWFFNALTQFVRSHAPEVGLENPELINIDILFSQCKEYLNEKNQDNLLQELDALKKQYDDNQEFIKSASLFEECAKKEAQSQLFRTNPNQLGKLIGNISDIAPFVYGVNQKAQSEEVAQAQSEEVAKAKLKSEQLAKAHQQIIVLSFLINSTRWGVTADNLDKIDEEHHLTPEQMAQSINQRSSCFSEKPEGPRSRIGWSHCTEIQMKDRMQQYYEGIAPVLKAAKGQVEFYKKVGEYKALLIAIENDEKKRLEKQKKGQIDISSDELYQKKLNLKTLQRDIELEIIKFLQTSCPELWAQVTLLNPLEDDQYAFINSILKQVEESIVFGLRRELKKASQKQEQKIEKPVPGVEAPGVKAREVDAPEVEAPKVEAPKVEAPKVEAPKVEAPVQEVEAPVQEVESRVPEVKNGQTPSGLFHLYPLRREQGQQKDPANKDPANKDPENKDPENKDPGSESTSPPKGPRP